MRCTLLLSLLAAGAFATADTLEFHDGRVLRNCYVRDEGIRIDVWENLAQVGAPPRTYPRSAIKSYKVDRGDEWDVQPKLPDLTVAFIELNPKLAGLHGLLDYDQYSRPSLVPGHAIQDVGAERKYDDPAAMVKNLKFAYTPGETITMTANVRNLGFAPSKPFAFEWLIDGASFSKGKYGKILAAGGFAAFEIKWPWKDGRHTVTFRVVPDGKEIASINDSATDPLWGMALVYAVNKGRVEAWRQARTAYGTFSFEDFYRWHLDVMNLLLAEAKYPSTPDGCLARVRLDKILYTDDVPNVGEVRDQYGKLDGVRYDQGGWVWQDDDDKNKSWKPATKEWRNQTEWSLPHELGHQLGLIDWYNTDYPGDEAFVWPDNGEKIAHFMSFPNQMMHWHGPHLFGENDAANLNYALGKPRGYFGEYLWAMPKETVLQFSDVNGQPLEGAKVELFQRGFTIDPNGTGGEQDGVRWFPVVEDGDFHQRLTKSPVISGTTGPDGRIRLPNRPTMHARTLTGYEKHDNPFGNFDVVGPRQLMLAKVTVGDRSEYFYIEAYQLNVAWHRGQKDRVVFAYRTPFGSLDSPMQPSAVAAEKLEGDRVRVTWQPGNFHSQQYLEWPIGYRVWRRVTSDSLSTRPWMPVATLGPDAREFVVDARQLPAENWWNSNAQRYAVSTIGFNGRDSELVGVVLK